MREQNRDPHQQDHEAGNGHQEPEQVVLGDIGDHRAQDQNESAELQAVNGHPFGGEPAQAPRGFSARRHRMQHPRRSVNPGIGGRQHGGNQNEIHQMRRALESGGSQHLNERAGLFAKRVPRD
ncbi:hypothetical protein D1872_262380 [compost metagenome]